MINSFALNTVALNAESVIPTPPTLTGEGLLILIEQQVALFPALDRSGFALNQRRLNRDVLNGFSTNVLIGSGLLISIEQSVGEVEEGLLISVEQTVGIVGGGSIADGLLISIEQEVQLRIVGEGTLISIEQEVVKTGSGLLVTIEQTVIKNPAQADPIPSHVQRTGWDITVMVGGAPIDCEHGIINIQRTEGGASLMNVTLIPALGIQDVESYAGKPITADLQTAEGIFRVYTGLVDIPEVDIINKKITLHCTDRRSELINTQLASVVSTIGYYSSVIFGTPKDTFEELTSRLTTVPQTVDFDAFGNYNLVNLAAKTIPDYTLLGSQVYYRDPKVEYTSRGRITNKITISFEYRFDRLWHLQRSWSWVSPIAANICLALQNGYTFAQRSMVLAAITGLSWPLIGDVSFRPIQPSGWYCGGMGFLTYHFDADGGAMVPELDADGNPVLDADGNPSMVATGVFVDVGSLLTNGASWTATKRWAQTITENYSLIVQAPQSQAQYGVVESFNNYSNEDGTDVTAWERDYKAYDNPYNKTEPTYFIDSDLKRNVSNAAISTALNIAKTTILNSHRDIRVTIYRSLWPQIDLKHTVEIDASITNGGGLKARGKVYNIVHTLDVGTGEAVTMVILALSRSQGTQIDSALSIPIKPTNVEMPDSTEIVLGNHYGEDPAQAGSENWNGRVGNRINVFFRTTYPEQFIVDTPEIESAFRDERVITGSASYSISIPSDLLEVIF